MIRERAEELWTRALEGEALDPSEARELAEALAADPGLRAELLDDEELDGILRSSARASEEEGAFLEAFREHLAAERTEGRFVEQVRSRLQDEGRPVRARRSRRRAGPRPAPYFFPALAAAGFAVAILLLAVLSKPPVTERREASAPVPAEPEPAAAPLEAEHRFRAVAREKARLEEARRQAESGTEPDLKRRAEEDLARVTEEFKRAEEALRRAREAAPPARAIPPDRVAPPAAPTLAAVATLAALEGDLELAGRPARAGESVLQGQEIRTRAGRAVVAFADGTRVEIFPGTTVREISGGKSMRLESGTLSADVAKQPADRPMTFATPQGTATVLGTSLRLVVDADSTRLEVREGRVRLTRASDRKSVVVASGHYAVAATGLELASKTIPIDDVLLLAGQGKRAGSEWSLVKDEAAAGREAWECRGRVAPAPEPKTPAQDLQAWGKEFVEFRFVADGQRDYHVWVRGACVAERDPTWYDQLAFEFPGARVTGTAWSEYPQLAALMYNGHGTRLGYGWIGGNADGLADAVPSTVRFARTGPQVLRLRAWHKPIAVRVDAIWLSATQKSRPDPAQAGPK